MKLRSAISRYLLLLAGLLAGVANQAGAQEPGQPSEAGRARGILVEDARNDSPTFYVRVGVDHPDRTYRVGEEMRVTVSSEREGYLYLIYLDASKSYSCLFPNRIQNDNLIKAGDPSATIPQPGASFRLRVAPPCGQEVLKAIVTLKPLEQLQLEALTRGDLTALSTDQVKAVNVEVKKDPTGWAEHFVDIVTVQGDGKVKPPGTVVKPETGGSQGPAKSARRVGLFVGISQYKDPKIPTLSVGHKDAQSMADVMQQQGKLDEVQVLLNDQATWKNVEQGICNWLPQATKPGDTIVLYWSGHGGRCADTQGHHKDGYDAYLVPTDGVLGDADSIRKTMILDDTFGRWLQYLDGRRVAIILDTCHSGGQSEQGRKGIKALQKQADDWAKHFIRETVSRTKEIGQKEMALLASSTASQVSFERREGDLSVMTYHLLEQLQGASGSLTLPDAFNALKGRVKKYVDENFPGSEQTPILVDYSTPPLYLRP